jgi:hypothetical protein
MPSHKTNEIIQQITRDRAGLLKVIEGLLPNQTDYRPADGVWSIADVLHHLALTEEAQVKLQSMFLKRAREENVPADPDPESSVLGSVDAIAKMADGRKAKAPDRVVPRSHVPAAESLQRLETSRKKVLESVEALSAYDLSRLRYPHPFFGELDCCQWLLITGWHERRHAGQIGRIREDAGFPKGGPA